MTPLDERFYVSAHLDFDGIEKARCLGFSMVINNRPDHEDDNQIMHRELEQHALKLGMSYRWIPLIPGEIEFEQLIALKEALAAHDGKTIAFCRTGGRSSFLWSLLAACSDKLQADEVVKKAQSAGFDFSSLHGALEMARMVGCKEAASQF